MKKVNQISEKIEGLETELIKLKNKAQKPFRKWIMIYELRNYLLTLAHSEMSYEEKYNYAISKINELIEKSKNI